MTQYEPFQVCLRAIMEQKRVSVASLTRMTGYKSRNSVTRILQGEASPARAEELMARLTKTNCLCLTAEEEIRLRQALKVSGMGEEYLQTVRDMLSLLTESPEPDDQPYVCDRWRATGPVRAMTLEEALRRYASGRRVKIILMNLCERRLYERLASFLSGRAPECEVRCSHYLFGEENELPRFLAAVQPLMYQKWYAPYLVDKERCPETILPWLRTDFMTVEWTDEAGRARYHLFVPSGDHHLFFYESAERNSLAVAHYIRYAARAAIRPLRDQYDHRPHAAEDYLRYTQHCLHLEQQGAICCIRQDFPLYFFHPDILAAAVTGEFARSGTTPGTPGADTMLDRFYAVHLKRWENVFNRPVCRQNTALQFVFSRPEMERFLLTGRSTDHFFGFRAFTVSERRAVLSNVRRAAEEKPYFEVYFLRPGVAMHAAEISMLGRAGVLFTRGDTCYRMEDDLIETLVSFDTFTRQFQSVYTQVLLRQLAETRERSLEILDELLTLLDSQAE